MNNLLLLTHPACAPCVLKRNGAGRWVFEPYVFEAPPWRFYEYREEELLVLGNADGSFSAILPDGLPEAERAMEGGDLLRASFYTEERECFASRSALVSGVQVFSELSGGSFYAQGAKLAYAYMKRLFYMTPQGAETLRKMLRHLGWGDCREFRLVPVGRDTNTQEGA